MHLRAIVFLLLGVDVALSHADEQWNQRGLSNIFPSVRKVFGLEPEVTMTLPAMVRHYGYPVEVHSVTTEDGYILTTYRIPRGRNGRKVDPKKLPVLLFHGAYASSDLWVANVPDKSFGYMLADAGYDVWMLNCRGTFHSRKHVTLKEDDNAFWDFSIDEFGNDASAFIDDVLKKTKKNQVYALGHSMGGGILFSLLADRPEYNAKIRKFYALSPAGTLVGIQGFLPQVLKRIIPLLELMKEFGLNEFGSTINIPSGLLGVFVKYFEPLVKTLIFSLVGQSPDSWNATRTPVNVAHGRGSAPVNMLIHFAQRLNNPEYRHFDWGVEKNRVKYGQSTPPEYNLDNVVAPTQLFYASSDYLTGKENVEFFKRRNSLGMSLVGRDWNHLSYFWATDANVFIKTLISDILKDNKLLK